MARTYIKDKIRGGFVALPWNVLNSKAYIALKPSSAKALPYFIGKGRNMQRKDKIYFPFPYAEADRLGFAPATFSNLIKDLMGKGFIDPIDKGGLRSDGKSNNMFALSVRWDKYGEHDFEKVEWSTFEPIRKNKSHFKK